MVEGQYASICTHPCVIHYLEGMGTEGFLDYENQVCYHLAGSWPEP